MLCSFSLPQIHRAAQDSARELDFIRRPTRKTRVDFNRTWISDGSRLVLRAEPNFHFHFFEKLWEVGGCEALLEWQEWHNPRRVGVVCCCTSFPVGNLLLKSRRSSDWFQRQAKLDTETASWEFESPSGKQQNESDRNRFMLMVFPTWTANALNSEVTPPLPCDICDPWPLVEALVPQQRELMGSSAQISSGVRRCVSQAQVPEGSARSRRVLVQVLEKVPEAGSGGRFPRQVPEGSGRKVLEGSSKFRSVGGGGRCKGSGRFGEVPESVKGQAQVLEGFASLWTKQCTHVQIWNWESSWTWRCYVRAPAVGETTEACCFLGPWCNWSQQEQTSFL